MNTYFDTKGNSIHLANQVNSSGEGVIFKTSLKGHLAKIYHNPDQEKIHKLRLMVANPPEDPMRGQGHVSIAWPIDLLHDNSKKNCVGFLMPEISNAVQLLEVYNSKLRNKKFSSFNWYCLHVTSLNVALIVKELHLKNYIIGDLKTQNLLVNPFAQVSIVDTDSFQVTDNQTRQVYRCPVGSEGFTPPELIGKNLSTITQTRFNDRFRLGVIIYLLLFTHHPFMGSWQGSNDPPGQDESISKGYWPYGENSPMKPSINTIALDIVHPSVKDCFLRCFNEGHQSPTSRPSPDEWIKALSTAIISLEACSRINNHIYEKTYGRCYWCERAARVGVDIFPTVQQPILPSTITAGKPQVLPQRQSTLKISSPVASQTSSTKSASRIKPQPRPAQSPSPNVTVFFIIGLVVVVIVFFLVLL